MAVRLIYPQGTTSDPQHFIMEAILFSEDGRGTGDRRAMVGIDPESWDELLPFIHSIYLRVDAPPTSPRDRDREQE